MTPQPTDTYTVKLFMDGKTYWFQWPHQAVKKVRATKGAILNSGVTLVIKGNQIIQF